jgi:hypothetical protein
MRNTILLGRGGQLVEIPRRQWEAHLAHAPAHGEARRSFMTETHRQVRYFVVREMPRIGEPITPAIIAQTLGLTLPQVNTILDDLEKHLFFLTRNEQGAVSWAYPVTVEPTPHRLTFNTGERLYAA